MGFILILVLQERPLRIMDFKIDDSNLNNVTFSWTAPQESFGKNGIHFDDMGSGRIESNVT